MTKQKTKTKTKTKATKTKPARAARAAKAKPVEAAKSPPSKPAKPMTEIQKMKAGQQVDGFKWLAERREQDAKAAAKTGKKPANDDDVEDMSAAHDDAPPKRSASARHAEAKRSRAGIIGMLESCVCTYPLDVDAATVTGHAPMCPSESLFAHTRGDGESKRASVESLAKQAELDRSKVERQGARALAAATGAKPKRRTSPLERAEMTVTKETIGPSMDEPFVDETTEVVDVKADIAELADIERTIDRVIRKVDALDETSDASTIAVLRDQLHAAKTRRAFLLTRHTVDAASGGLGALASAPAMAPLPPIEFKTLEPMPGPAIVKLPEPWLGDREDWKLAMTCTCTECTADVGEFCVEWFGRGRNRQTRTCKVPHASRVESATKAIQLIDAALSKDTTAPTYEETMATVARKLEEVSKPRSASEIEGEKRDAMEMMRKHSPQLDKAERAFVDRQLVDQTDVTAMRAARVADAPRDIGAEIKAQVNSGVDKRLDELAAPKTETIRQRQIREAKNPQAVRCALPGCVAVRVDDLGRMVKFDSTDERWFCDTHATEGDAWAERMREFCAEESCASSFLVRTSTGHVPREKPEIFDPPQHWWVHEENTLDNSLRLCYGPCHRPEGERATKEWETYLASAGLTVNEAARKTLSQIGQLVEERANAVDDEELDATDPDEPPSAEREPAHPDMAPMTEPSFDDSMPWE